MKITKTVNVDVEVEVHVSSEDIAHAIMEVDTDRYQAVFIGLNNVAAYLKAISDEMIATEMSVAQKQAISTFLKEQSERFANKS